MMVSKKKQAKIYFWLRLETNFYENLFIKKARRLAGGDTMVVIYQRLMLLSLATDGVLYYEGELSSLVEELALKLGEAEEEVEMTIAFFSKAGLIQINNGQDIALLQVPALLNQESDWARYKRQQRQRQSLDNVQGMSNTCPTEKELEQELEKEQELKSEQELEQEQRHAVVGDAVPQGSDLSEPAVDGSAVSRQQVFDAVKQAFGEFSVSGFVVDEVNHLLTEVSAELLIEALRETKLSGGRSIKYTRGILRNWQGQGLLTVEQVRHKQKQAEQKGSGVQQSAGPDLGI